MISKLVKCVTTTSFVDKDEDNIDDILNEENDVENESNGLRWACGVVDEGSTVI